jgi:Transposase DDE domain group 1
VTIAATVNVGHATLPVGDCEVRHVSTQKEHFVEFIRVVEIPNPAWAMHRPAQGTPRYERQRIAEANCTLEMTRLSCHRFRGNEVRLLLSILAYNLGNLWRRLALPGGIEDWSLTSMQQRLVKTGGRLVKHTRYYWPMLAEGHLTHERFAAMLRWIAMLPLPAS